MALERKRYSDILISSIYNIIVGVVLAIIGSILTYFVYIRFLKQLKDLKVD